MSIAAAVGGVGGVFIAPTKRERERERERVVFFWSKVPHFFLLFNLFYKP